MRGLLSAYQTVNGHAPQRRTRLKVLVRPVRANGRWYWLQRREVQEKIVVVTCIQPGGPSFRAAKWVVTNVTP